MIKITVQSITSEHLLLSQAQITAIYADAFTPAPYHKSAGEIAEFAHGLPAATRRAGFVATVAQIESIGQPIGFCYGYAVARDSYFYQLVAEQLGDSAETTTLLNSFQLVEMAVLPHYHGQGIGGQLHDLLLDAQPNDNAVLATISAESNASKLYASRGWRTLVEELPVPQLKRTYRILHNKRRRNPNQ